MIWWDTGSTLLPAVLLQDSQMLPYACALVHMFTHAKTFTHHPEFWNRTNTLFSYTINIQSAPSDRSFSCDLQRQMWNLLVLSFASLKKSWWNPTEKSEAKSQHLLHPTKLSIVDFTLNDVLVLRVLVLAEWVRCDSKITIWHLVFCCCFLRPASIT